MKQDNPYVGPRPFELDDKDFFFGRDRESQGLLSLVLSQRVVLFFAPSGAGKSSLINTRLIPGLIKEGFFVHPVGRVKGSEKTTDQKIANVFTYNLLNSVSRNRDIEIPDYLSLAAFLEDVGSPSNGDLEVENTKVLIIDQFEELFTSHLDRWQDRKPFFEQLRQSLDVNPLLWLVLVMREDHIAKLEPYASLLPGRFQSRFYMSRMNIEGALEAIKRPADKAGKIFSPGVAEQLVDNLRQIHSITEGENRLGEFIEPVQLQVVCRQLWANLTNDKSTVISADDVRNLGDIDKALAQFYDSVVQEVARLAVIRESELRTWFEKELITETGTRALVYEGTKQTGGLINLAVHELTNRYLLRADIRPSGTWYELIHDRFILPIQHSNAAWLTLQSPLLQDAYAWERSGRNENLLYHSNRLGQALSSIEKESQGPVVSAFLQAGKDVQEHQILAQRAATARRDRILLVFSAILVLGLSTIAVLFWQQRQIAIENVQLAQAAQLESSQGRATIAANAAIQAEQLKNLQDSLEQQLLLLEEQKLLLESATSTMVESTVDVTLTLELPLTPTSAVASTITRQSFSTPTPPPQAGTPTLVVEVIETQIAQVNATQTAIAIPASSLVAIFPNISIALLETPSLEAKIKEFVVGGPTLPVIATNDRWVEVEFPNKRTGWVNGFFLTYQGDEDKLPPGLRYRLIFNRDEVNIPYHYGEVHFSDGISEISLLRDPNDLNSGFMTISDGDDVIVLINVPGSTYYGSGRWYLVDVVKDGALWTGYLPVEAVFERE